MSDRPYRGNPFTSGSRTFDELPQIVETIQRHKHDTTEEYIEMFMKVVGCSVKDIVLCHEYDGKVSKVWIELKEER